MPPRPPAKAASKRGRPLGKFTQNRRYNRLRDALEAAPSGLTIMEIAELLRVTQRSARRYLDELKRALDLEPVLIAPGGANRWRLKATERGRAVALRRTQAVALLSVRSHFEALKGAALYEEIQVAMEAIRQIAERPGRVSHKGEKKGDAGFYPPGPFVVTAATAHSYSSRVDEVDELFGAIVERYNVRFEYSDPEDSGATMREREAAPLALVVHNGQLYCIAHETDAAAARLYLFNGMKGAQKTRERFAPPTDFRLEDWLHGEFGPMSPAKPIRVVVEFDAAVADEIRNRKVHPSQKLATAKDGRMRLSFAVPRLSPVKRWVLGFGGHAHVVEPQQLRIDTAIALQEALAKYGL